MRLSDMPPNLTGWTTIPDLNALQAELCAQLGRQRGHYAVASIPADGWRAVFDLRLDGCSDGFVCERNNPDGTVASVCWESKSIKAVYPPRKLKGTR